MGLDTTGTCPKRPSKSIRIRVDEKERGNHTGIAVCCIAYREKSKNAEKGERFACTHRIHPTKIVSDVRETDL